MSDVYHYGYAESQKSIELTIQSYIKNLSLSQMAQVLEFIEYLQFKNHKEQHDKAIFNNIQENQPPISQYAGMIKLPKTGVPRNLMEFDVASMAKDD